MIIYKKTHTYCTPIKNIVVQSHTETPEPDSYIHGHHPFVSMYYSNTPLFQEKLLIIVFQAFEHPRLKFLFQYPNTYTLRSSNGGRRTSTSLQQSLPSYREGYRTSSSILLEYYNHFQISTRLLLLLRSLNGDCQTSTTLRQSLWSSNGG